MLTNLDDALTFLKQFHAPALEKVSSLVIRNDNIPTGLRKVYEVFGKPDQKYGPINGQDSLSGPEDLKPVDGFIHFLSENQACWSCAFKEDGGDDPAVYLFEDDEEPIMQSDSLEEFLITFLLQESVMTTSHLATQEDGLSAEGALNIPVEPLWLEAIYSREGPTHWFYKTENPQILIMRFDGDYAPWLWLASYEDRWEEVLRPCEEGFVVAGSSAGEETRVARLKPEKKKKRLPKWLRWLE